MKTLSTRAAAKKLGLPPPTLAHYIRVGKVPRPKSFTSGDITVYTWSEAEIEHVRQLLPKIANGRKTRYSKLREKQKPQPGAAQPQHAKIARAGDPGAVPHKSRRTKKKSKTRSAKG
jgi:predicted DNA-binding transcriptional regulator AlpA